jgi:hypothetical protein
MDWSEWRSSAGFAANITSLAFKFAESFKGKPTPELHLEVKATGGGTGVDFSAVVSEIANRVPAIGVYVYAELEGEGVVFESRSFTLRAGELEHLIMFGLQRPKYGTLVKECNDQTTLYGRTLTVTAVSDNGGVATREWVEDLHEPGSARYEAMQEVWARKGEEPVPGSREELSRRLIEEHDRPKPWDHSSDMG